MNNLSFGKGRYTLWEAPFPQVFRIMKITTALLLVFMTCAYGSGKAQKVSLSLRNVKIEDAFKEISRQTNYKFLYSDAVVKDSKRINLEIENQDLNSAMLLLLSGNRLTFKIIDETISVSKIGEEKRATVLPISSLQQNAVIGTVRNAKGEPLVGASVSVKGMGNGVTTDAQGAFRIQADTKATLVVRFVGYAQREVSLAGRSTVVVELQELDNELETVDVVATGYQNLNPKLFTGSAVSLKGKDVIQEGVTDLSRALEGRVAGVSIQNVSGTFGAAPKVRIRGASSLTGDNKPLWVIDGVILEDVVNISND
ncbi:MAG: carboxypeptidase-like regulatory domain-containing protein, partial [Sphingobacterium sp.]|nr:carboxypeptidase-like regulatory domain-containing protein [Sphingobacterium sp.]